MNKNRKLRFNAIDVLILLLIAAVIYVVLNVFVLNSDGSQNSSVNYKTIQYVVEVGNLDERFAPRARKARPYSQAPRPAAAFAPMSERSCLPSKLMTSQAS